MTAERSNDLALAALIVSIIAHIGVMYYMSSHTMAQLPSQIHRTRNHVPMQMGSQAMAPESLHFEVLKDLEPLKNSPGAEIESPAPAVGEFEDTSSMPSAPAAPEFDLPTMSVPVPVEEAAPPLSERFSAQVGDDIFATPIAPVTTASMGQYAASAVAEETESAKEEIVTLADIPDVLVPEFELPAIANMFGGEEDVKGEIAAVALQKEESEKAEEFIPTDTVLPSVDEKVVEAEKAAVRDLLDVVDAGDLETFVSISTASAMEGDYVYFSLQFKPDADLPTMPKDIVVLIDASGSIGKDRLSSCVDAAKRILRSCTNTGDRFNLVAFRDRFSYAFKNWQECNKKSLNDADKWLEKLGAHGRTDVFATIRSVLTLPRDPARPLIAIVVTDGDANAGISETSEILSKFTELNDGLVSVYMYGVKREANRELIDVLTHGNRGESFIYGGERWNAGSGIETLAERFRDPVLSDLRIVFTQDSEAEIYPQRLRNLYRGEGVDLVGRVKADKRNVSFSIRGLNNGKPYEGFFNVNLATGGNVIYDSHLSQKWKQEKSIDDKLK